MTTMFSRPARLAMVALAAFALSAAPAMAQAGKGKSMGSRGSQTYSAPPATQTAPNQARPMERSVTQPNQAQPGAATAAAPAAAPSFGKALMGGMLGGFLGAGLFSLLSGGGLGGFGGMLMMLLQIALIGGLVFLVIGFLRRRSMANQPAMASANGPQVLNRDMNQPMGGGMGGGMGNAGGFGAVAGRPLEIVADDYQNFERLLGDIQAAYSREDIGALRTMTTPEMAVYFDEALSDTAAQGKVDRFGPAKLLQGDLAEAWSEGADEYATVAMRFSLPVSTVDRATGKTVSGDLNSPKEFTEIWTFRRTRGEPWKLSAIQQTM